MPPPSPVKIEKNDSVQLSTNSPYKSPKKGKYLCPYKKAIAGSPKKKGED
jgi:hypothetical protein